MNIKPNGLIEVSWGHIYGRPYGVRDAKKAGQKVQSGEWELVSDSKWQIRGDLGGLKHGHDAIYRIIK